ncbi:unnamed protein product [Periconia digitata]|uniref:Uncharacterized protein n=1 Tax=Periconia digitata TaxID=1303443 RepID=A0A9W4XWC8_9PLEO|nr:unnamed protein product [Periconia digitata]
MRPFTNGDVKNAADCSDWSIPEPTTILRSASCLFPASENDFSGIFFGELPCAIQVTSSTEYRSTY